MVPVHVNGKIVTIQCALKLTIMLFAEWEEIARALLKLTTKWCSPNSIQNEHHSVLLGLYIPA